MPLKILIFIFIKILFKFLLEISKKWLMAERHLRHTMYLSKFVPKQKFNTETVIIIFLNCFKYRLYPVNP